MNNPIHSPAGFIHDLRRDLHAWTALAEDLLALATREQQALSASEQYEPLEFFQPRKDLLVRLNLLTMRLKHWRSCWQQISPAERAGCPDVNEAIQMLQHMVVNILQLDRENRQVLLRRGQVPASCLQACAAPPPARVARLYHRHSTLNLEP